MASTDLKRLRTLIEARKSAGGRLPREARAEVAEAIEELRASGASYTTIAAGLGVPLNTVSRWRGKSRGRKLVAVRVPLPAASQVIVHGPRGLRIEGLSLDDVAALLTRLS